MAPTATSERPLVARAAAAGAPAQRLFRPAPGGRSLEDAILHLWEDLVRDGSGACPACGGRILLDAGCESCGSELS